MRKETESILVSNSRLAVANSIYIPIIIGCLVISAIYIATSDSMGHVLFGWLWIILSIVSIFRHKKKIKEIGEQHGS